MTELLFTLGGIVAFSTSVLLLVTNQASFESLQRRVRILKAALVITFIAVLVVIPLEIGAIAREETSAFPWNVWLHELNRSGYMSAMFGVFINLVFLLWAFLIPGHLYANSVVKRGGARPVHAYVINILVGLILCTPSNPIYGTLYLFFQLWS